MQMTRNLNQTSISQLRGMETQNSPPETPSPYFQEERTAHVLAKILYLTRLKKVRNPRTKTCGEEGGSSRGKEMAVWRGLSVKVDCLLWHDGTDLYSGLLIHCCKRQQTEHLRVSILHKKISVYTKWLGELCFLLCC